MTIAENITEIKAFWYRVQIEQSHFREIVYTLASIYRDPKKSAPSKRALWPIEAVDGPEIEEEEDWATKAHELLERNKNRIGKYV